MGLPALTPPSYRRLALRMVVVLAIPGHLAGLLAYLSFPLSESQVRALDVALPASVAVLHGITLLVLRVAAAPLRRALEGDEDVAGDRSVSRASAMVTPSAATSRARAFSAS